MDARDTTIFVVGVALVVVNAAVTIKPYLRRLYCLNLGGLAVRRLQTLCTCMRPRTQSSEDAFGKLVAHRLERRRVAAARFVYVLAASVLCLATASILINLALHTRRWIRLRQIGVMFAGLVVLALVNAWPALLPRLLDVYHGLSMLALVAFVGLNVGLNSGECFDVSYAAALIFRVMFSMMNLKVSHTVVWNLVGSCATCVRAWYSARDRIPLEFYTYEACGVAIALSAAIVFKLWTVAAIRREIQLGVLKSEVSASMSLLGMVCDIVVELDSDMTIARDSPTMATLLMGNPEESVAGTPFCDFVPSESEKRSLREQLSASRAQPEASTGTCHVQLSDSLQNLVHVEVFYVKAKIGEEEDCRYMLGIRGVKDDIGSMPMFMPRAGNRPRQHRGSARRGTPHTSERFSFEIEDPQASADVGPAIAAAEDTPEARDLPAARQRSEDHSDHRFPEFKLTGPRVKCEEVLVCMSTWNVKVPRNACCPFHAYVWDVRKVIREKLMRLPCINDFPDWSERPLQCQGCGILIDPGQAQASCHLCGAAEFEPRARRLEHL